MIPSTTYTIATQRHQQHLDTAARSREIRDARRAGMLTVDRTVQRRLTAARLATMSAVRAALHL
jgi:hypothetical protein